ncbi:MAG TPA: threonylcarbamoyl-AMP synthase [Candidatus Omnitrophica bacterium]|nr:threonylcarbamoyl-AMP synthase [Candidatus Omnitrophota bacterium]
MKTQYLKISPICPQAERIRLVVETLKAGGLVVLPTETVYGIGFDPDSPVARDKITRVKSQRDNKPYSWNLPDIDWLDNFNIRQDCLQRLKLIGNLLPGPITFIMCDHNGNKLGFRIPANSICRKIIQKFSKPIYLPSANPSNLRPACSAQEAMDMLWGEVDMIVDGGPSQMCLPSAVVDLTQSQVQLLRSGPPFVTAEILRRINRW